MDAATRCLVQAEEAALAGEALDDDAFDALVRAYCRARRDALVAREGWHRWQDGLRRDAQPWLVTPTARLRFARWLYLHGRIAG